MGFLLHQAVKRFEIEILPEAPMITMMPEKDLLEAWNLVFSFGNDSSGHPDIWVYELDQVNVSHICSGHS